MASADTVLLLGCMFLKKENDPPKTDVELPDFLTWVSDEQKLAEKLISSRHLELSDALKKSSEPIPLDITPIERLYWEWESLLSLFGDTPSTVCKNYADTKYYQSKMARLGRLKGKIKVAEYHALYKALQNKGFLEDVAQPVIILDGKHKSILIDGAHRSVLMRHMGQADVKGYRYKTQEILSSIELSDTEYRALQEI